MDFAEKADNLPQEVQDVFSSNKPRLTTKRACLLYDIKEGDINKVSWLVGDIFVGDVELKNFPMNLLHLISLDNEVAYGIVYEINKEIFVPLENYFRDAQQLLAEWESKKCAPLVSEEKARRRLLDLEPWIEEEEKEKAAEEAKIKKEVAEEIRKSEARLEKMPFAEALRKFPKLGEQSVTSGMLKLKYVASPVRPSIKNWITDYQDFAGAGHHTAVERGNFIFHGENTKGLAPLERQKVTFVLRVLDENSEVQIDSEAQTLMFKLEGEQAASKAQPKVQMPTFSTPKPVAAPAPVNKTFVKEDISREEALVAKFAPVQKAFPVEEHVVQPVEKAVEKPQPSHQDEFRAIVQRQMQKKADLAEDTREPRFNNMAPFGRTVNLAQLQKAQTEVAPQADFGPMHIAPQAPKPAAVPVKNIKPIARITPKSMDKSLSFGAQQVLQQNVNNQTAEIRKEEKQAIPNFAAPNAAAKPVQAESKPEEAIGKISFSSPQKLTPPQKFTPNRSPYRITPRGYEYNKEN